MHTEQPVQTQDPLAELRDIHLPGSVPGWPPAPGWWFAAVLVAAVVAFLLQRLLRYWRGNRYRRDAVRELQGLYDECKRRQDAGRYVTTCAQLLKRVAMVPFPREEIAALYGEEWVAFLDRTGDCDDFSVGPGELLVEGPYRPGLSCDMEALHRVSLRWLKRHRARRPDPPRAPAGRLPAPWLRRRQAAQ